MGASKSVVAPAGERAKMTYLIFKLDPEGHVLALGPAAKNVADYWNTSLRSD